MSYVVAEPCVDVLDRACVETCPVDCIYEGDRMMYIQPAECIDCGACESACPQGAIFYTPDLPEKWSAFNEATEEFFAEVGSPGGAELVGRTGKDAAFVAALPVRT